MKFLQYKNSGRSVILKKLLLIAALFCLPLLLFCQDESLLFHFDFSGAEGKNEWTDRTGRVQCFSKNRDFVIQQQSLRIAPCAEIFIPSEQVPVLAEELTISTWILKKSTPEYAPLLMKGSHGGGLHFLFTLSWRYPAFCYKVPGVAEWRGIDVHGLGGGSSRYGDESCMVPGAIFVESSGYWKHLVAVFRQGLVQLYIDGKLVARQQGPDTRLTPNDEPFWIGAEKIRPDEENYMSANILINDLRLYSKALSEESIQQLYAMERPRYPEGSLIPPGETHINALPVCYDYIKAAKKGYDPEFETTLPLTAAYEKRLPARMEKPAVQKPVLREVRNGRDFLNIDGETRFPLLYIPGWYDFVNNKYTLRAAEIGYRDFAAAGINLGGIGFMPDLYCLDEGKYDWSKVDSMFERAIRANPGIQLLVEFSVIPPPWFERKYPEEMEKAYFGQSLRRVSRSGPLGSELWLQVSNQLLKDFVEHVENSSYGHQVFGYNPCGGQSGEWYWPGSVYGGFTGYSQGTAASFRNWLRQKYGNDPQRLRQAWNNEALNFETAEIPSPAERMRKDGHGVFLDPARHQHLFDLRQYKNDRTFLNMEENSRTIKVASGGRKQLIIFSGYSLPVISHKLYAAGLETTGKVFRSRYIDAVGCLLNYTRRRGGDHGLNVNAFNGSARLHGKMMWMEDDPRTHFHTQMESGRSASMAETLTVLKRSFGYSLTRNQGVWWRMFDSAWYHHEEIMRTFQNVQQAAVSSVDVNQSPVSEVALFFDLPSVHSVAYDPGNSFISGHTWETYGSASRMGAPFDAYLLEDIADPGMPDYKLYVFMNAWQLEPELRAAIEAKVRRNHAVSVWCYAPGYLSDGKFQLEGICELTGINLEEEQAGQQIRAKINPGQRSAITRYYRPTGSQQVQPAFFGADPEAKVLATADSGQAILLSREFSQWRSVYSLLPLNHELLLGLCEYAGVHVYSRSFDVLSANQGYIMLHTSSKGGKTIELPGKFKVREVFSGEILGNNIDSFSEELPEKETRIYQLSR